MLGTERTNPSAIRVVHVSRCGTIGAFQRYRDSPLKFDPPQWIRAVGVEDDIRSLLPPLEPAVTPEELKFVREFEQGHKVPEILVVS